MIRRNSIIYLTSPHLTSPHPHPQNTESRVELIRITQLTLRWNQAETSEVLKRAVEENDCRRAHDMINAQLDKIRSSVSAVDLLFQQLIRDLEYQYSNQYAFKTTMTNMYMQHGQERATYSTGTTQIAVCYMTSGQERFRSKYKS